MATTKEEVHQEAMLRWDSSYGAERPQREQCVEDMEFAQVKGMQWDDLAQSQRTNRPRYEINKLALHVNQVVGDQRQNRMSVNVRPSKDGADQKIAEVLKGLIRNIEKESRFKDAKDNAFFEVCNGGFGAWYVTTEYTDDDSFEQDIAIKTIRSAATSVYFDPGAVEENKQDAMWAFVAMDISKELFKKRYPKATESSMPRSYGTQSATPWVGRDTVRIADYWVKKPYMREIALMTDGSVIELDKDTRSILDEMANAAQPVVIAQNADGSPRTRRVKAHKVVHYKVSGDQILEGPTDWAGKYIPVVPIFGYNIWINGVHYYRGMVRLAMDAQRIYNYATSSGIEQTALAPKDPFWVTPKQMQGFGKDYRQFNTKNSPFMRYNPDPKAPGPPQRTGAPAVQQALIAQIGQADADIMATTGRFSPSLGDNPAQQSGRAVLAQQAKGDLGTEILSDNLVKGVEYTGKILVDLIPRIYDTQRTIRVLGDNGDSEEVQINRSVVDLDTGKEVILFDLTQGKYETTVDTGPSYATQRSEVLNTLNTLAQSNPQFAEIAPDLIAKMVDFEYAPELSKRFRKILLKAGVVDPNEEEQAEIIKQQQIASQQPPDPMQEMQFKAMQLELEKKAADVDTQELENEQKKLDLQKTVAETGKTLAETIKVKTEALATAEEKGIDIPATPEEDAVYTKNLEEFNEILSAGMQEIIDKNTNQPEG